MQERRILTYLSKDDIPSSAQEITTSILNDDTAYYNVLYIPLYNYNFCGNSSEYNFPYIQTTTGVVSSPFRIISSVSTDNCVFPINTDGALNDIRFPVSAGYSINNYHQKIMSGPIGNYRPIGLINYVNGSNGAFMIFVPAFTTNNNTAGTMNFSTYNNSGNPWMPQGYIKIIYKYPIRLAISVQGEVVTNSNGSIWEYPIYADYEEFGFFDNNIVDLGLPSGIKWSSEDLPGYYEYGAGYIDYMIYHDLPSIYSGTDTTLPLSADSAHCIMKGKWRIPTAEDFQELIDNTTQTHNSNVTFTATNGNSITLNNSKYYNRGNTSVKSGNYYLTSSRNGINSLKIFSYTNYGVYIENASQNYILKIRPIWDPNL